MSRLRNNIFANYVGQIWTALISIIFIPLYIHILGIEAFGLIAFMLSLQAIAQLFDFGIGGMINREIARRMQNADNSETIRNLVRTFEWLIWPISILVFICIWSLSGPIASHWLHPHHLSRLETIHAITIMGVAIASLWPNNFYSNGLSGLERQTTLNLVNVCFVTLRNAGVLPILYWVSPTLTAFFWWYSAMGLCQSLVIAVIFWKSLPNTKVHASFNYSELTRVWRFAGGVFTIAVLSLILTQIDRLTLSTMRPLEELGYYGVALSITGGLGRMIVPMFNAIYPRFSSLIATKQQKQLIELYHLSSQCLAVVVAAASMILIAFGKDVLFLWTNNQTIADQSVLPLTILVAGTALNGMIHPPYALQLANGWTKLAMGSNFVALILGVPFTLWAVAAYGMTGAACLWLGVNAGYFIIQIPIMHRRLLRKEMWSWYLHDVAPPVMVAAVVALTARYLTPTLKRDWQSLMVLLGISALTLLATAFASNNLREIGKALITKRLSTFKF